MERYGAQSRMSNRRPLTDVSSRANIETPNPPRPMKSRDRTSQTSSSGLPHHESVASPNHGPALNVRDLTSSPDNKRLSAAAEEDSKRNSQASTSTNASGVGKRRKTHIGPWQLGNDIGTGGCGKVRKVRHSVTGDIAAAKIISKKMADVARAESLADLDRTTKNKNSNARVLPYGIEREVVIMKLLDHANVVRLYDVWENHNQLYLVMEYVEGGELFSYIEEGRLEEDEACWIFRQIVAALCHCHRLGIYHRDIKPENILLTYPVDPETGTANPQVKIVDFGMAALQPKGKKLTTPCGTLHYAAPELLDRVYDGSKIDVWSLGVILFVMLTGRTPFHLEPEEMVNSILPWYQLIKKGEFFMPPELSAEAQDLIRRMIQPNPRRRIDLEAAWQHPFFRKWSRDWGETAEQAALEHWIGVGPKISNWHIKTKDDIDRETLRNLQTLWHSEQESVLIQRLLNREPNFEKVFYSALQKHQEEALENFIGAPDGIGYSSSDYHHVRPVLKPAELPPIPATAYERSSSKFSLQYDETGHSKGNAHSRLGAYPPPPPSISSYDPFRASRDPIISSSDGYNVVVHRGGSNHTRKSSNGRSTRTSGTSGASRVDALKRERKQQSTSPSPRPAKAGRRTNSRSSIVSSPHRNSPAVSIHTKPSLVHKRGVNFSHVRRSSTTSALPAKPDGDVVGAVAPPSTPTGGSDTLKASSSAHGAGQIASRKEGRKAGNQTRARKSATSGTLEDSETRKVSTELEKFCEEAFNRSSAGSTIQTGTNSHGSYGTPASSVSKGGSVISKKADETPNTFIVRELAETRKRLAEKYSGDERAQGAYQDILLHLDSLLQPNAKVSQKDARKITSAPDSRPSESGTLPIISEEDKGSDEEGDSKDSDVTPTQPQRLRVYDTQYEKDEKQLPYRPVSRARDTIRVIEPPSPPRVAPLNIRKVSNGSPGQTDKYAQNHVENKTAQRFYCGEVSNGKVRRSPPGRPSPTRRQGQVDPLLPIFEDPSVNPQHAAEEPVPKRRNWFKRLAASGGDKFKSWEEPSERPRTARPDFSRRHSSVTSSSKDSPTTPTPKVSVPGKRVGFLSFLSRRRGAKLGPVKIGDCDSVSNDSANGASPKIRRIGSTVQGRRKNFYQQGVGSTVSAAGAAADDQIQSPSDTPDLGVQQNWLARFLHIKPASRIVCFAAGRGRVRSELVRLLRSWKMYGMVDVVLDKEKNLAFGRLAPDNYLGIKEVAFVIEMFVVLEHGRHAGLCLTRFTQRKGAASSFRKVVDTVETMMSGRGLLVEDEERKQEMEMILQG